MADQLHAGNSEPERQSELEVNIGEFRFRLTGNAATTIATTGTFAIAGFIVYNVLNSEKLTDCIAHAITKGCVEIEIIAKGEDATNQVLPIFSSNKILETFNKALERYPAKQNKPSGKFDKVELIQFRKSNIKESEWSNLEKEAIELRRKFEKELNMTFERTIKKKKVITTTVEEEEVTEKVTYSAKSSTSSAQQQEAVKEERPKVGAIEAESSALKAASRQAPAETEKAKQTSSTLAAPEKTLKGSDPQTTQQGNTVSKERGRKRKSAPSDSEDEESPSKHKSKFNVSMKDCQGVHSGDHGTINLNISH